MRTIVLHWIFLGFVLPLIAQTNEFPKVVEILEGKWQMEQGNQGEQWIWKDGLLTGQGYSMKNGEMRITESLQIAEANGNIVYSALVPNQNEGEAIAFRLNPEVWPILSFENLEHDFPKKIRYSVVTKDKLKVQVWGEENQGMEYHLIRVD